MKPLTHTILAAAALAAIAVAGSAQAATTLRMNSQWPASAVGAEADKWFAEQVEARTDGELQIKIYWSEGLGEASETLSLLQNNAIDMASLSPAYFPAQLPLFTAPNSFPMAMKNTCQASRLMERLVDEVPGYMEEAKANGIRPLFFHVLNPYLLVSKKPITSVEDMEGVKMRTWGSHMPRMVEAAGGTPVTMGMPEIYESLSRGVIDAAPFAVDLVVTYNIYEVAKHVSEITLWEGPTSAVWITDEAWSKMTPKQQEIVHTVSEQAKQRDLEAVQTAAEEARAKLKKEGVTFHDFPEAEKEKWKSELPNFFDEWIADMEEKDKGDAARQAVEIWKEVVANVDC